MELLIATKNKKKLKEIKELLKGLDVAVRSLDDCLKIPRVVENGRTFKENAVKKAVKLARQEKRLSLGEDSGLCVNALDGKPGVHSSRFAGSAKSDRQNNLKVLKMLEGVPIRRRGAHYTCAVALADKDGLVGVVEGKCYGRIGFELKGTRGFGYDPLFVIPEYKKTFAELGEGLKHKMSHRWRALKKAKEIIRKYIESGKGC